ncbi:alpha/beta hydrolase [Maricaulis parjimensis]|uniref:alpha/beta hydrolase n=1 Tax=Maricaulis parjimensis TaxID=144023 RepID=UPI001939BE24|nr:alpha/beta hydrolase [Maricaulis parjimensis]
MWFKPYSSRPVGVREARRRPLSRGTRAFLDSADPDAPPIRDMPLDQARAVMDAMMGEIDQPGPAVKSVADVTGPEVEGQSASLRVYEPKGRARGILVFFHGGGWTLGGVASYDGFARRLCQATGQIVASVDYPLSPEHKYPLALQAGLSAVHWAREEMVRRKLKTDAISLAGDSAGGTLAAALALRLAKQPEFALAHLALFYPVMVIPDLPEHASRELLGDGRYFLSREDVSWAAGNYLADPDLATTPDVSPLLAEDFTGLPPVSVITAGYDPLRDEGADFVRRVRRAGGQAELFCFETTVHGFMGLSGVMPEARPAFQVVKKRLG